ncbi:MAG TPA: glycosyltransferase family 1 protein [Candidatus Solibacter sp.]|nr:glycosyltransferase family 1 protein [Candidatus Solibacter sp.]
MIRPRVALDGRTLQARPLGGVGRAISNLIEPLAGRCDLTLLLDARLSPIETAVPHRALRTPVVPGNVAWLQLAAAPWLRGFDGVFHCPFYGLPYLQRTPMVVTFHDLSFELHPEWMPAAKRTAFRAQARHAARTARVILTDSEFVRRQVVDLYGVGEERVVVAPLCVDPVFTGPSDLALREEFLTRLQVKGPYVVAFSGARRRRLEMARQAWLRLRSHGFQGQLVIIGREPVRDAGVVSAGNPTDRELAELLRGAAALCYPTEDEGFGMPALEAIACGCPVVCFPVGSLPEILGDAAEWCDGGDLDALATGLQRVVGDTEHQQGLRERGRAWIAASPGWDDCAAIHVEAYRAAIDQA